MCIMTRHMKLWQSSSWEGCLKLWTMQPCGFTPLVTCLIVESLPALAGVG
ncbi:hypothetical protein [Paratractidigestivibacter sp.]|nr:hypothetical protein [Paratractidigestivibacter sp.]